MNVKKIDRNFDGNQDEDVRREGSKRKQEFSTYTPISYRAALLDCNYRYSSLWL